MELKFSEENFEKKKIQSESIDLGEVDERPLPLFLTLAAAHKIWRFCDIALAESKFIYPLLIFISFSLNG